MKQKKSFPRHVAIIMDGNGRWAKQRDLNRTDGHKEGIKSVDAIISASCEYGLETLVLYAFSSENWNRPQIEIKVLMGFLSQYLDSELKRMQEQNIVFDAIGRLQDLPKNVFEKIVRNREETRNNTGLHLVLALNYGGRNEILDASRVIARQVLDGMLSVDDVNEEVFRNFLYLPMMPDPDLLIRTSGEMRISNFLLWQISYTELYVTEKLWPDFRKDDFLEALQVYGERDRRFGK